MMPSPFIPSEKISRTAVGTLRCCQPKQTREVYGSERMLSGLARPYRMKLRLIEAEPARSSFKARQHHQLRTTASSPQPSPPKEEREKRSGFRLCVSRRTNSPVSSL